MATVNTTISASAVFTALHPDSRRILLQLLAEHPGLRHKELSIMSGLAGTCWHHLMVLYRAGLINRVEIDKDDVQYSINKEGLHSVARYLISLAQ
jgi:predicted transcriptional regulator